MNDVRLFFPRRSSRALRLRSANALAVLAGMLGCAIALLSCTSLTIQEYADIVESARACSDGDSCVLVGSGECSCSVPVNAREAESVAQAAMDLDCNGAQVDCASHDNVRCEAGRCISDTAP